MHHSNYTSICLKHESVDGSTVVLGLGVGSSTCPLIKSLMKKKYTICKNIPTLINYQPQPPGKSLRDTSLMIRPKYIQNTPPWKSMVGRCISYLKYSPFLGDEFVTFEEVFRILPKKFPMVLNMFFLAPKPGTPQEIVWDYPLVN